MCPYDLHKCLQVAVCLHPCIEVKSPLRALSYILLISEEYFSSCLSQIVFVFIYSLSVESVVQYLDILGFLSLVSPQPFDLIFLTICLDELKLLVKSTFDLRSGTTYQHAAVPILVSCGERAIAQVVVIASYLFDRRCCLAN